MMIPQQFLHLSAQIGSNPLLVQGPGGNTSVKEDGQMWVKASGTELANAETQDIFTGVSVEKALAELDGAGDGSCRSALLDSGATLRPSIETTFHALLPYRYVFHFHSVGAIAHVISSQGRECLRKALADFNWRLVPYRKPGIPLTKAIRQQQEADVNVFLLQNHGIIVAGDDLEETAGRIEAIEQQLKLPILAESSEAITGNLPEGWQWSADHCFLATDKVTAERLRAGSYYPDHVVFLGPALPVVAERERLGTLPQQCPVGVVQNQGVCIREDATSSQQAMLGCLADVLSRIPSDWTLDPIGTEAEAELLDWDAEKYRQELAARGE